MSYEKPSSQRFSSIEHIVFLGTHNANPFKKKILDWLPRLDLTSTTFVISDNASTDGSEEWLRELCGSLSVTAHYIQNKSNYGGYGNLISTLEKFPAALWITTLHQDDFYDGNHVQNHRKVIEQFIPNLGMICSEAESVDSSNRVIPFPRAIWLLQDQLDPVTVFLAHLKQHVFPFSGASISTKVLKKYKIPSHSTAFPDTELVMKMIAEFGVKFADGITVKYLENPKSESHHLSTEQKEIGAFVALSRVFSHPNFKCICDMVPIDKRQHFYSALQEGIAIRFSDATLRRILTLNVLELVAEHLNMDRHLAAFLADGYRNVGDSRAVGHLEVFWNEIGAAPRFLLPSESGESTDRNRGLGHSLLLLLLRMMPRTLRKRIFRSIMETRLGRHFFPSWDLFWNRR